MHVITGYVVICGLEHLSTGISSILKKNLKGLRAREAT